MEITRDRAKALLGEGDFDGAIAVLQELTATETTDALAWQMLGAAYGSAGRSSESIGAFHRAVELQPGSARAQFNLALSLIKADRGSEARGHLERALALDPGYEAARTRLAELGGPLAAPAPIVAVAPVPPPAPEAGVAVTPVAAPPAAPPPAAPAPPPMSLTPVGGLSALGGGAAPTPEPAPAPSGLGGGASVPSPLAPPSAGYAPPPAAYAPRTPDTPAYAPAVKGGNVLGMAILAFFCFGVILGPISIYQASRNLKTLDEYPNADQTQRGMLNAARICGIVATVWAAIVSIVRLAALGSAISGGGR